MSLYLIKDFPNKPHDFNLYLYYLCEGTPEYDFWYDIWNFYSKNSSLINCFLPKDIEKWVDIKIDLGTIIKVNRININLEESKNSNLYVKRTCSKYYYLYPYHITGSYEIWEGNPSNKWFWDRFYNFIGKQDKKAKLIESFWANRLEKYLNIHLSCGSIKKVSSIKWDCEVFKKIDLNKGSIPTLDSI